MRNHNLPARKGIPQLSVIMACFNEQKHIGRAIESIQSQSISNWELIVIDDGSTDDSVRIIQEYAASDSRIHLTQCGINLGLPACLNIGIFLARAPLIARADADDLNLSRRFEHQLDYMNNHSEVDVLGTGAYLINSNGLRTTKAILPSTHQELEARKAKSTIFFHPSVVIRRSFFDLVGVYDVRLKRAQDRELWLRGFESNAVYANLPICLVEYTTNDYRKSWAAICQSYRTGMLLAYRYKIPFGLVRATVVFVRSVAIKLRIYKPRSMTSKGIKQEAG